MIAIILSGATLCVSTAALIYLVRLSRYLDPPVTITGEPLDLEAGNPTAIIWYERTRKNQPPSTPGEPVDA